MQRLAGHLGEEPLQAAHHGRVIGAREVRAPDALGEDEIAHDRLARGLLMRNHASRRVPGRGDEREAQVAQLQDVAVADQPLRGDAGGGGRVAEEGGVERRGGLQPVGVARAGPDRQAVGGPEVVLHHVIPVAVGVEHGHRA